MAAGVFLFFFLSHSKKLRRSCEIGSLHHHATSWRQHSKRKVSSVSFDRSSISCAVESLVKPKFFLSDLQAGCVNKKSKKTTKTPKQHSEMPRASSLSHYSIIRSTSSSQLASTARWNTNKQKKERRTQNLRQVHVEFLTILCWASFPLVFFPCKILHCSHSLCSVRKTLFLWYSTCSLAFKGFS